MLPILDRIRRAWAFARLYSTFSETRDEWVARACPIPASFFSSGCASDFGAYLRGPSRVAATTVDDVHRWLSQCAFKTDQELFGVSEYWQHPEEFEGRRAGDCDDFAVWAWRKFAELGLDTELMVGMWREGSDDGAARHAWVVYHTPDGGFLLEAVNRHPPLQIRPLAAVRHEYEPHFSVDQHLRQRVYGGFLRKREAALFEKRPWLAPEAPA